MQNFQNEPIYKKVGEYELTREIGSGSFARVYRARNINEGTICAVKMISKELLSEENLALIEKEIEILQALDNRYIIKLLDFKKTANNW